MQLKTILNRVEKFKCFVYGKVELVEELGRLVLLIQMLPRSNSKPVCSQCGRPCPGYDTLEPRRFEYVPLWGIAVFFVYAMRRVCCPNCWVVVERVPWAEGKEHLTRRYQWFLARWARRMSWKEVAEAFQTTWEHVFVSVEMAVHWGLGHRVLDGITAIGVDEVQFQRGHKYLTVVYQLNEGCKRLLWVGRERTVKTLLKFFRWLGPQRAALLEFVCSDMWKPYLKVIARKAKQALNVLDRYHIVQMMNKAIDKVRATEAKELASKGYDPVLKHTRWCLLKRPENLTDKQDITLRELVRYNLKTVRAYLLKEDFQLHFWDYVKPGWAERFLERWCTRVMRSRLEPMKQVARSLRSHANLIMNWFKARGRISLGAVEGLNNKEKVITRRSYGFRSYDVLEIALYHAMGELPEPTSTHRFC
jgi:transposase